MTATDSLEVRLRGWFDEGAPGYAPDGLLESVTAQVELTRQPPAWVPSLAFPRWFAPAPRLILLAVLIAVVSLLLGVFSLGSREVKTSNGLIAYVAPMGPQAATGLFVHSPETESTRLLLTSTGLISEPTWSPDGSRLAYLDSTGDVGSIRVVMPETGEVHEVAAVLPRKDSFSMAWSPDGSRVAYSDWHGVYVASADGERVDQLTSEGAPPMLAWGPAWSGDNSRLTYTTTAGVMLYDLRSASAHRLISGQVVGIPEWSRDSSFIVFESDRGVESIRPDGSGRRLLGRGSWPSLSPDGQLVAYQATAPQPGIWVVGSDGTDPHVLVSNAHFESWPGGANGTVWSPDGQWIRYLTGSRPSLMSALRTIHPDGTGDVEFWVTTEATGRWAWQPVQE